MEKNAVKKNGKLKKKIKKKEEGLKKRVGEVDS